jgi:tetratricopeptide (TPR) repeat protein
MKRLVLLFCMVVSFLHMYSQEKEIYLKLLNENKMTELKEHLDKWKISKKNDPEMFIGFFNYYVNLARNENIVVGGKNPPKNDTVLSITDPKTGENIGYMYGEVHYDPYNSEKALQVINEGLQINPNRLDMHFGKAKLLEELHAYKLQKEHLLNVFIIGSQIKNKWLWSDNQAVSDTEDMIVGAMHDYIAGWFNAGNEQAFYCIKDLSEALIKYYPKNAIGYNDCGLFYANTKDLVNAEKYFLLGFKYNSSDDIIIGNLAYLYESKNNINESIKYYKLMEKSKNTDYSEYARKKLLELKK